MNLYARFAVTIGAASLAACTSAQNADERPSAEIAAFSTNFPIAIISADAPVHSDFDAMRAALPGFYVERAQGQVYFAIVRNITFRSNSALLSDVEVGRLAPVLDYLSDNPGVAVLIRGYGDHAIQKSDAGLGRARADTIARALQASMMVGNEIITIAGAASDGSYSSADIQFTAP